MYQPHDLLFLKNKKAFQTTNHKTMPKWADKVLDNSLAVVVRRGHSKTEEVLVGLRGTKKNERLAGVVATQNISKSISPEIIATQKLWENLSLERLALKPFQTIMKLPFIMNEYQWGIGGSCGFEIITGIQTVTDLSDVDLIIRGLKYLSYKKSCALLELVNSFGVHIDIQIINGLNSFSLEELCFNPKRSILVKTGDGPILTKTPWKTLMEV